MSKPYRLNGGGRFSEAALHLRQLRPSGRQHRLQLVQGTLYGARAGRIPLPLWTPTARDMAKTKENGRTVKDVRKYDIK